MPGMLSRCRALGLSVAQEGQLRAGLFTMCRSIP